MKDLLTTFIEKRKKDVEYLQHGSFNGATNKEVHMSCLKCEYESYNNALDNLIYDIPALLDLIEGEINEHVIGDGIHLGVNMTTADLATDRERARIRTAITSLFRDKSK